ncbi:MAG TPA: hypothetical protein VK029_04840 [Pseudogracilibacillus sp.]|nr:hypothetical protein [Pseudogracilibacillus sp.]
MKETLEGDIPFILEVYMDTLRAIYDISQQKIDFTERENDLDVIWGDG